VAFCEIFVIVVAPFATEKSGAVVDPTSYCNSVELYMEFLLEGNNSWV
jgi:hypothetical protein